MSVVGASVCFLFGKIGE